MVLPRERLPVMLPIAERRPRLSLSLLRGNASKQFRSRSRTSSFDSLGVSSATHGQRRWLLKQVWERADFQISVVSYTNSRTAKAITRMPILIIMANSDLIVETPHGASIQRTKDGHFMVCDGENHCRFTRSLYSAEQELGAFETGFLFPYSTGFRQAQGL